MAKHTKREYYDTEGNLIIKPYHLKDLATIFDVNNQTLKRWIKNYEAELGPKVGKYYSIQQVECLITRIGLPKKLVIQLATTPVRKAA